VAVGGPLHLRTHEAVSGSTQQKENYLRGLEALLRFPFYADAVDASGKTPLFYCTSDRAVSLLCARGADANAFDERGVTPIHQYVLSENVDCVRTILRFGADPSIAEPMKRRNCIHFAAAFAHYRLLDVLLTNAEFAIDLDACDAGGNTALHLAAACQLPGSDPLKVLLLLLDRRASPSVRNNQGTTVLHLVCANPLLSPVLEVVVGLLLQKGADPNAQDCEGCTPLIVACAYRDFDVCRALLARGGDLNIPCKMQSTFLSLGFVDGDCDSSSADHSQDCASESLEMHARHAITTSDLLPKKPRYGVFSSIRCAQSKIRSVNRDRCMNCGDGFAGEGPKANLLDAFQLTTGRHHCRHCRRVVCPQCATRCLSGDLVPEFVQVAYPDEVSYRVCDVCYDVLVDRQESGWELPADWAEGSSESGEAEDGTVTCDEAGVSDDPTFVERWKNRLLPKWSRSDSFGTVHADSPAHKDESDSSIFSFSRFGFTF
jgi:ankyrin repeat protein